MAMYGWPRAGKVAGALATWALLVEAAPAAAASEAADARCQQAATAERRARELERNAEKQQRFSAWKGAGSQGAASRGEGGAPGTATRASIERVRALLPQLREAAVQARHFGMAGMADWFQLVEGELDRASRAAEACLGSPGRCIPPALSCPQPPPLPPVKSAGSAEMTRQIQGSTASNANMVRQKCLSFGDEIRQARAGADPGPATARPGPANLPGGVDFYSRMIQSHRREAARYRAEADGVSGIHGYCLRGPQASQKGRPARTAATPEPLVVDLAATWSASWSTGPRLGASSVPPLPRVPAEDADGAAERRRFLADAGEGVPPWWESFRAARMATLGGTAKETAAWLADRYRLAEASLRDAGRAAKGAWDEANEEVKLKEFVLEKPKALVETVVTTVIEAVPGGKSVVTGYKITSATRDYAADIGQILVDTPRVAALGTPDETRAQVQRAEKAQANFVNAVFVDDALPKWRTTREAPADE